MAKTAHKKNQKESTELTASIDERIAAQREPTTEEIALRAYEIYLERGEAPGNDIEDWLQAEQELRGEK